ncbi:ferrochelatase [Ehrlichia canis]|uniref:Ferrochelatase n=1 Tax=Ehrlichia canis (strain Jake) TaxID=269484 RepID=A0ACA6AWA1_EHRCJ|nr:ferrochelatase [Ehrlichia canis]AAZ68657.1 Ferrochelatase [Ehrlichia canis str. Jake]AUO54612.1 ferrochelatase [Ehrlichia canis]UKC53280.1 ferrochelatase [Ehrlichia canis]UKC54217.1 ferrochelatase [Ehrlichia canis]UKC55153.1 ferrochelatase [Ehrlichia canis]
MSKIAVVLFNLGGPQSLSEVRSFLFNLFYDKNIINLANPLRFILATLISFFRKKKAIGIYKHLNGQSPILKETKIQASSLENILNDNNDNQYQVFIFMRYSQPSAKDTVESVCQYNPDKIILLPLYPHYSTTTTLSAIQHWNYYMNKSNLQFSTSTVCCYYNNTNYIKAQCQLIIEKYQEAQKYGLPRVLFSAHSLPISIMQQGDPYQHQIEKNVLLITKFLNIPELDYKICYQSKVGPVKWLEPSTISEIKQAKQDNVPIVLVPISFVSENSETLVELDIDYKAIISKENMFFRVPTLSNNGYYIKCLKEICMQDHKNTCPTKCKMCFRYLTNSYL